MLRNAISAVFWEVQTRTSVMEVSAEPVVLELPVALAACLQIQTKACTQLHKCLSTLIWLILIWNF